MARNPRVVIPGVPHHITQRGNRRGNLFFTDQDRDLFIRWLTVAASKQNVSIIAYCLMTNHIHIRNLPIGGSEFISTLEAKLGRVLKLRRRGRPRKL